MDLNNVDPVKNIDELSSYEIKILLKEKLTELDNLKFENNNMKKQINERNDRFNKREKEYKDLIIELKEQYETKICKNFNFDKNKKQLKTLNYQINDNIESIKIKTYKILAEQEKDIIRFYNSKIKEIKQQFDKEKIKKGKKDIEFLKKEKDLINELEWVKDISKKIDDENHNWMKEYIDLISNYNKNELEYEELLSHLIFIKKKNAILYSKYADLKNIFKNIKEIDLKNSDKINNESNIIINEQIDIVKQNKYLSIIEKLKNNNNNLYKQMEKSKIFYNNLNPNNKLKSSIKNLILNYIRTEKKKKFEILNKDLYNILDQNDKIIVISQIWELDEVKEIIKDKLELEQSVLNDLKTDIYTNIDIN